MEFFFGSVTVLLTGPLSAMQLSQIAQEIPLEDVKTTADGLTMRLLLKDVRQLRRLLHGQGIRMHVLQRRGLPFVRVFLRRNSAFAFCLAAALLTLMYLSGTVLQLKVSGTANKKLSETLLQQAEEMGLKRGVPAQSIDRRQIERALQDLHPELTYVSIRRQGTNIELFVVEATQPPKIANEYEAVDVIAASNGLITNVTVFSGVPLVRPGDTVRQGQVLIQGVDADGNPCRAAGQVTARLWQTGRGEAELYEQEREHTGKQKESIKISLFGFEFPRKAPQTDYAAYDTAHARGLLLDGLFFPIQWDKMITYEVQIHRIKRDNAQAHRQAAQRALCKALQLVPNGAQIVDKRLEYSKIENEKLYASLTLETLAQIGVQKEQ